MRGRYGGWTPGLTVDIPRGCSYLWRAICRAASTIMEDIHCMIGDGTSIIVTQDVWIGDIPFGRWPTFISPDVDPSMRVSSLISQDRAEWNASVVPRLFGRELAQRILAMPLPRLACPDFRVWRRSCLPCAPIRDLVARLRSRASGRDDVAWIWRLPIHPRVQLFLWKLIWGRLPTCSLLADRGLAILPLCPLCGMQDESIDHAIFLCSRASHIWQLSQFTPWLGENGPARLSFLQAIRQIPWRRSGSQGVFPAYLAYHIWLSRNQMVFVADSSPPHVIIRRALRHAEEYIRSYVGAPHDGPGRWDSPAASVAHRSTVFISWEPPPPGFVKVNFDGSVSGRSAGSGFLVRGSDGQLLAAGGHSSFDISVPMAELQAVWAGITHAVRHLGYRRLIVEGDSLLIIRWLRREEDSSSQLNPLIRDILTLLRTTSVVVIRHIYREANAAADWVASMVARHPGQWVWQLNDSCPVLLQQILFSDTSGLTRTRVV